LNYTVKYGETIFDLALIAYQDASRVVDLINENPNIDLVSDLTGLAISFTPAVIFTKPNVKNKITTTLKNVSISNDKTIFDIALQYFGDAAKALEVVSILGLESVNSDPAGTVLTYTESNESVPLYFRQTGGNIGTKGNVSETAIRVLGTENGDYIVTDNGDYILIT
jgi:hypothetical protein